MYIDKRNNNKVSIIKEINLFVVLVKNLKNDKRYLVEKSYLKEIK